MKPQQNASTTGAIVKRDLQVRIQAVDKVFHRRRESVHVLKSIDLDIERGEFLVLLGPSGCGKTTLLRCLVGLERPTRGSVELAGETVVDAEMGKFVPSNHRNVSMVFQNYGLWPHMRVRDNVAYPLKARKRKKDLSAGRVQQVLETVQCSHLADRYPVELSGGQQQRVSLARALAPEPALLLLDEPLSNLDALLRVDLRAQLRILHRDLGFTAVYVTHDQDEALALGTRVAVMNEGRIEQIGAPEEVYRRPATEYVSNFLGARNRIAFTVRETHAEALGQRLRVPAGLTAGEYVARVRPSGLVLRSPGQNGETAANWLTGGVVREVLPGGDASEYLVEIDGQRFSILVPTGAGRWTAGDSVDVGLPVGHTLFYDASGLLVPCG